MTLQAISNQSNFVQAMIDLKQKDIIEYEFKMSHFRNQVEQQKNNQMQKDKITKCPKCNSTNIQIVKRKWSLLMGFATNKVDRICVNCKHKF